MYTNKSIYVLKYKIKSSKIKNYWSKKHNNSGNLTKPYIFDKNFANFVWTVFRLPFLITFFEVI